MCSGILLLAFWSDCYTTATTAVLTDLCIAYSAVRWIHTYMMIYDYSVQEEHFVRYAIYCCCV